MSGGALAGGSTQPLVEVYDAALLDLDGVVYVGPRAVDHAAEALQAARAAGMRLAFVTNNAARTPEAVAAQLTDLGVPALASEVATSAQAAARVVAELVPAGAAVLVVGGEGLEAALRARGLRPVRSLDDDPAAVVQGYHPSVGWEQLAEGTFAVRRGLPWVASNTDLTIPTARGIGPGNGTLVEVIRLASGASPIVAGKPELALHRESAERVGAQRPLVVGDRLDTDILGATRAQTDSLLVLTGVTDAVELLAAPPDRRPTYLAEDLRGLLVAHDPVDVDRGTVRLGGWTAQVRDKLLELTGGGRRVDGLRVACVAAWTSHGMDTAGDVDTTEACARLSAAD
ncbi:MAG TPA: HAD-IIA family hydrolase [Sporichthyaceae bacterium]|nr:HAD-IIA family hydrolase [Sporichthyaceae bacterium]